MIGSPDKVHDVLQAKINTSYDILRLATDISLEYYQKPLVLTYSGGKDSQVLVQLALECLKPNEFEVVNSHTTVDAPETVYFIRDEFKKLNEIGVKTTIQLPRDKNGKLISMWSLIEDKQMPPTRFARYCCEKLKETTTPNSFVALGVRESESFGRRSRNTFIVPGKKNDATFFDTSHIKEVFEDDKKRRMQSKINDPNEEGIYDCKFITNAKQKNNLMCYPIYKWIDSEIWEYINSRHLKYNPLYDKGFIRVGCIGCPLSGNQAKEFELYPKFKQNYINAFERMLKRRRENGKDDVTGKEGLHKWVNGEAVYRWWIRDKSFDGQMNIFDFIEKNND